MMKKLLYVMLLTAFCSTGANLLSPQLSSARCQIPCGIYDDHARVHSMLGDVDTIEISVNMID